MPKLTNINFALDNEYLQTLFSDLPDAILLTLPDGTITHANDSFYTIFGYSIADIKGCNVLDLYSDPFILSQVKSNFAKLSRDLLGTIDAARPTRSGSTVHVKIRGGPIYTLGELSGLYIVYTDVTEQKELMDSLEREKIYWQELFHNSPEGIILCDENHLLKRANPEFCRMFGYSPDEITGKPVDNLITNDPKNLEEARNLTKKVTMGGRVSCERVRYRKDGTPVYVSIIGLPFMIGSERVIYAIYRDIGGRKQIEKELRKRNRQLENSMKATIETLARMIEIRDPFTSGHQRRVSAISEAIALKMGYSSADAEGIRIAGIIHDIGKINIPSEILSKPGMISDIEYRIIQQHPEVAYDILREIEFPWPVAQMVYQHHERMDGSGYPRGLKGEEIIPEARILAVADVVEAMISHRPYRAALSIEEALQEIEKNMGILYDNEVARVCLDLFRKKGFILPPTS